MNKTKYILIALVAVFSLMFWGSRSFAEDDWVAGTVQSYYSPKAWQTFEAGWLIGYRVYSPVGGDLGQITDLMIDRSDGHVALVILSDVPGLGDRFVAAPFSALMRTGANVFNLSFGDRDVSVTDTFVDPYAYELQRNASTVTFRTIPSSIDPLWADSLYRFYGRAPYWSSGSMPHPEIVAYRAAASMSFAGLIGSRIRSDDGKATARIEDLIIDAKDGRVALVVLDEVSGRGDALVAVPFGELSMSGNAFVLNTSGDRFASAPGFMGTDSNSQQKAEDIYRYFGEQPYWTEGGMGE